MSDELNRVADDIEAQWYGSPKPSPARSSYRGPDGTITIVLDAPAELLTMNTARGRIHWRQWAALTGAWRLAMKERAQLLGIPHLSTCVGIEGRPQQFGGTLADAGAHMPCLKAMVDGLRDAHVLTDDSPKHVAYVRCWAPVKAPGAGMILELVPLFT